MILPVYGETYEERGIKKNFSSRIALIDADYLKYLVASGMYKRIMEDGLPHSRSMLHDVIDYYLNREIFGNFEAKAYVFCFSAPSKQIFRNSMAQEAKYKGNRENREDKTYYVDKYDDMAYVYEYINSRYQALVYSDLEADDLLSILQNEHTFIFSIDKDLLQVPGFHFDMDMRVLKYITEEDGLRTLIKQVLQGDTVDGVPGLQGYGPVKVEKVCGEQEPYQMFISVINEFVTKKGLLHGIDTFVEMWSLVSMKINRGDYFREKYASAINIINGIIDEPEQNK